MRKFREFPLFTNLTEKRIVKVILARDGSEYESFESDPWESG